MHKALALATPVAVLATPVRAECIGQGCYDGLMVMLASLLVYALIALVLLVMLLRRRWRQAGVRALVVVLALSVGLPLISQGWQAWALRSMERKEVAGTPPPLAMRTPLLVMVAERCYENPCSALLEAMGPAGAFVLPTSALERLDPSRPLRLADLPLEHWSLDPTAYIDPAKRLLMADERRDAAARIDYVFLSASPFYLSRPGPVELALRQSPDLDRLGDGAVLRLGLAPMVPGEPLLLADLRFDVLDLWLVSPALAIPLAPGNLQSVWNRPAGLEATVRAICPVLDGVPDWSCRAALER